MRARFLLALWLAAASALPSIAATEPLHQLPGAVYSIEVRQDGTIHGALLAYGGHRLGDLDPLDVRLFGQAAWPQATVNVTGGDVIIAAGLGRRLYTVVARANTAGDTYTITVNGAATVLTEGVTFTCAGAASDAVCASNMGAAITANVAGVTPNASGTSVYLSKADTTRTLTIATSDATGISQTSGADGTVTIVGGGGGLLPASTVAGSLLRGLGAGAWAEETDIRLDADGAIHDPGGCGVWCIAVGGIAYFESVTSASFVSAAVVDSSSTSTSGAGFRTNGDGTVTGVGSQLQSVFNRGGLVYSGDVGDDDELIFDWRTAFDLYDTAGVDGDLTISFPALTGTVALMGAANIGAFSASTSIEGGAASFLGLSTRARAYSPADAQWRLTNNADTDFDTLTLGPAAAAGLGAVTIQSQNNGPAGFVLASPVAASAGADLALTLDATGAFVETQDRSFRVLHNTTEAFGVRGDRALSFGVAATPTVLSSGGAGTSTFPALTGTVALMGGATNVGLFQTNGNVRAGGGLFSTSATSELVTVMDQDMGAGLGSAAAITLFTGSSLQTAGSVQAVRITPTYNQAASTASNTDLLINRTETSLGSGTQRLIDAQVGGARRFGVTNTGAVDIPTSNPTVGTFTDVNGAELRVITKRYDWTNAMVTGAGATTGPWDVTVCTLPARTRVVNAYFALKTQAAGTTTLTGSLGIGGAFDNLVLDSNLKAVADTVYGDTVAESGVDGNAKYIPNWPGTITIKMRFESTVENLNAVTTCTGTVILTLETAP